MQYADFMVYERRTPIQVCAEKINRFHDAMIYAYDQAVYYKSIGDQAMYDLHMYNADVRSKHLSEAHQELASLSN